MLYLNISELSVKEKRKDFIPSDAPIFSHFFYFVSKEFKSVKYPGAVFFLYSSKNGLIRLYFFSCFFSSNSVDRVKSVPSAVEV